MIGKKVRLNNDLRTKFPNAFDYSLVYEITNSNILNDNSWRYELTNGATKLYIHESFIDIVEGQEKCSCSLIDLMAVGCKCGGI